MIISKIKIIIKNESEKQERTLGDFGGGLVGLEGGLGGLLATLAGRVLGHVPVVVALPVKRKKKKKKEKK